MRLALTLFSAAFPIERRGAVIGILQAIVGLALVAGPVIGVVLVPLALNKLAESTGDDVAMDLRGLPLVTLANRGRRRHGFARRSSVALGRSAAS